MDRKKFRDLVRKELRGLSKQQVLAFAYRCAVRILPFLGITGGFNYWKQEERQTFLLAMFRAIDVAFVKDVAKAAKAASAAGNAFVNSTSSPFSFSAIAAASNAARSVSPTADALNGAAYTAANAAAPASVRTALLYDLKQLKADQQPTINIETYGEVWDNFQQALAVVGCAYWGRVYEDIFKNNFQQDKEAVLRRLNVPEEIREQGAAAVANYLEELERGEAKRLNEARIIILGDKGAGKTCVARRLVNPQADMTTPDESTAGVDTLEWVIEGAEDDINVNIWDFAGHTVTHAAHRFFLSERCLYILVHNGRTENNERLTYWLDHMKNYGGNSKAIILVNRRDENRVDIPIHNLEEKYAIEGLHAFSVQDDTDDLERFRETIAGYIRNNPSWSNELIPESYYQVKEELEQLFRKSDQAQPQEHITKEEFVKIADKHKVEDTEQLLKDLHFLGVSLWYAEIEAFDSLVLNPEWISHGVYRIINWVSNNERSEISKKDFLEVFASELERYPEGKTHDFLFELMRYYELAYKTASGQKLIIPHLLKEDRPAKLPQFEVGESLKLQYRAEQQLPPHTISRFIVRHHEQIREESEVWRHGVVLTDAKGSIALIREEDRTISVSVKGAEMSDFLNELRTTLDAIFATYKSERPTLAYRIREHGELLNPTRTGHAPQRETDLYLSEQRLLNHVRNHRSYYDDQADEDIYLDEITSKYRLDSKYTWHIFLSHASEDKEAVALPLARALKKEGIQVWLDVEQIFLGDKLKDKLTEGVSKSRYGIVVFSKHYFQKKWPQQELAALLSREKRSELNILPILHGVSMDDVEEHELLLADRVSVSMTDGLDAVVAGVLRVLGRG